MALVPKLATKAMKKPAFKNVRSMVEDKAAARKEASTFKTIDQLKKEAIDAKPSTTKAVAPSSSKAAKRQKAETRLLAATGSMFTVGAAYENVKQKKGAPTAEAKGRRGGNIGTLPIAPQSSKKSIAEESDEEYRKIEADRIDRGLGPRSRDVKPSAPKKSEASGKKGLSSFGSAFAAARAKGESVFEFNGKKYNTMQKGETKEQHKAALSKSKLKPLKTVEEDKKALAEKRAKDEARKKEVAAKVKAAGLAKGGMTKKWSK